MKNKRVSSTIEIDFAHVQREQLELLVDFLGELLVEERLHELGHDDEAGEQ